MELPKFVACRDVGQYVSSCLHALSAGSPIPYLYPTVNTIHGESQGLSSLLLSAEVGDTSGSVIYAAESSIALLPAMFLARATLRPFDYLTSPRKGLGNCPNRWRSCCRRGLRIQR